MASRAISAITDYLASQGQRPVAIRRLRFSLKVIFGRGLSSLAKGYSVTAVLADGTSNTYSFAYDPFGVAVFERNGLKRYADGVWFDAC